MLQNFKKKINLILSFKKIQTIRFMVKFLKHNYYYYYLFIIRKVKRIIKHFINL